MTRHQQRGWRQLKVALLLCAALLAAVPALATEGRKATNVSVAPVVRSDLQERFTLPGTLEAWEDLTLAAEEAGVVRWIGPQEGDEVEKDAAILRIDPETLEANLARDQAEFDLQQNHFERLQRLVEKKLVSRQEFEDGRQILEVARAKLKLAQVALEKSTLKSPVTGVLDRLLVDRGEYVSVGTPAAVVVQVDRLKVLVDVPEKDIPFLQVGQQVEVIAAPVIGPSGPVRSGEIIHLAYKADPTTRTYRAKMAVENADRRLRPGMIVRVGLVRRALTQVVAVPLFALVDRDGAKVVYVEDQGVARLRPVVPGAVIGEQIVIQQGLKGGERLIVKGQHLVADGLPVTVVEE